MICPECRREVRAEHRDCGGDPRATCVLFGCGLPAAAFVPSEWDGHAVMLAYCRAHAELKVASA